VQSHPIYVVTHSSIYTHTCISTCDFIACTFSCYSYTLAFLTHCHPFPRSYNHSYDKSHRDIHEYVAQFDNNQQEVTLSICYKSIPFIKKTSLGNYYITQGISYTNSYLCFKSFLVSRPLQGNLYLNSLSLLLEHIESYCMAIISL